MQHYRLYRLDASDHIREAMPFEAEDDPAAIAKSESLRGASAMELWSGQRIVMRWSACTSPGTPSDGKGRDFPVYPLALGQPGPDPAGPGQSGSEPSPSA